MTLITCLVKWVQLSSQGSKEKILWYSIRTEQVDSANSGDQDPKPLKSSLSCFCSAVSFSVWMPWASSNMHLTFQLHLWLQHPMGSCYSHHWDLLLQGVRVCHTISHYNCNILAAIVHVSVGILYHQDIGAVVLSSAHRVRVITFNLAPVNAVFMCACMIWDEKASIILLPFVVTTSSFSVGSSTLVVMLSVFQCGSQLVRLPKGRLHGHWPRVSPVCLSQSLLSHSWCSLLWEFLRSWGPKLHSWTNPGLGGLSDPHHSPGLHLLEPIWWYSQ